MVLGLSQGGIIFLSVENPNRIYTRVSVHRDAVSHICEIKKNRSFVSISQHNEIKIWRFGDNKLEVLNQFNL